MVEITSSKLKQYLESIGERKAIVAVKGKKYHILLGFIGCYDIGEITKDMMWEVLPLTDGFMPDFISKSVCFDSFYKAYLKFKELELQSTIDEYAEQSILKDIQISKEHLDKLILGGI